MISFKQKVLSNISKIPRGKVMSYGQVAAVSGNPRCARQVGWILSGKDGAGLKVPWWRVVNSKGYLSIRGNIDATKEEQKMLLEAEGIFVSNDLTLDINKYGYKFFNK
jgi:methylated-DNA-protein-cysteine methyltransferase-like protein